MKLIPVTILALAVAAVSFFPNVAGAAVVILDTDFSNTTLYPPSTALGTVNDGLGAWAFNASVRALDTGGGVRGVQNTSNTSTSYYNFDSSYTTDAIKVEFSVIPRVPNGYFELSLSNGTGNSNIGPQIRLGGTSTNVVSYYNGSAFVAIPDTTFTENVASDFSFIAYIDGAKANTIDFYAGNTRVATGLDWRNDLSNLTALRMRNSTSSADSQLIAINISSIPEPSTASLALVALLLGGLARKYRSRA